MDQIADISERSIRHGFRLEGRWRVPELGGKATIDGRLRLHPMSDPALPLIRDLAEASAGAEATYLLYSDRREEVDALDSGSLMRSAASRYAATDAVSGENVRRAAAVVAVNGLERYWFTPEGQIALIASRNWCGRYVGRWHTHPPRDIGLEWTAGGVPSYQEMENAVRDGQFLTLTFQPDGFDLYDASALPSAGKVDLSLLKVITYRSAEWRRRFKSLDDSIAPQR